MRLSKNVLRMASTIIRRIPGAESRASFQKSGGRRDNYKAVKKWFLVKVHNP